MRYRVKGDFSSLPLRLTYRTISPAGVPSGWYNWTPDYPGTIEACWDETHKGPPWKSGGPCDIRRIFVDPKVYSYKARTILPQLNPQWVEAQMSCNVNPRSYFDLYNFASEDPEAFLTSNNFADTNAYAASGWNKARPGKPVADAAQFIAEFRDVPRTLKATAEFFQNSWKAAKGGVGKTARHSADSWLAANFGWLPFLSDLRKFEKTYRNANRIIANMRKHNNRWVRRERDVAGCSDVLFNNTYVGSTRHVPSSFGTYSYYFANNWSNNLGLKSSVKATLQADFRFVGRFKYWIPNIDSDRWEASARRKLYGLDVTPALVWELTPFSWLVDWASNVGDVLANLDTGLAENLVASYAYIMGSQRITLDIHSEMSNLRVPFDGDWSYALSIKDRKQASPFGFALTGADFSARQWSLLGAVGLQRLKF